MKSVNHVYEIAKSLTVRRTAVHNVLRNARKTREFKQYVGREDETVEMAEEWIENYENDSHHAVEIYDGIGHKKRTIIVPTTKELIVQHCIVEALKPLIHHLYVVRFRGFPAHQLSAGYRNDRPSDPSEVSGR